MRRSNRKTIIFGSVGMACIALAAGSAAFYRLHSSVPPLSVHVALPANAITPIPGAALPIDLPSQGSAAVDTDLDGRVASANADAVRPIASIAKTMTALEVVRAHPLQRNDDGPVLTMTQADVADYAATVAADGSALHVYVGERLTEHQLLLALLLPSANNIANTLARWVSGNLDAFVQRLNVSAAQLGMKSTHFADASGYSPNTVSTASDLVALGKAALADATIGSIVAISEATLPDGTPLRNLDSNLISVPGWLGIKTGESPTAGGCLLFAARHNVQGGNEPVTVIGAVLGQPSLHDALTSTASVVSSTLAGYRDVLLDSAVPPLSAGVTAPWGQTTNAHLVPSHVHAALRAGQTFSLSVHTETLTAPLTMGSDIATIDAHRANGLRATQWHIATDSAISEPQWWWRLAHG